MNAAHAGFRPEEQPLTLGVEFLHEIHDDRDPELSSSPTSTSTAVGSPAASIKLPALAPTPLPMTKFSILLMLGAITPLAFELIYPFVNAMIVDIGVTDDPEQVGFYSGLVESVFSLTGFIMILPCGYLSDTFGRKPIILLGMGGLAVSMVSFGLSKSLLGMIASRCIGGALGASWAAIKVMTGEMTDRSNQDLAFSSLQMTFRIGQIIGLPLGGLLAHPERRFKMFDTPFWAAYPYLFPCLIGAAFALFSVVPGVIFIEETLPSKRKQRRTTKRTPSYGSTATTSSTSTLVDLSDDASPLHAQKLIDVESTENKPQATWCSVMTPPILALLLSNTLMCIASETLFSIYPLSTGFDYEHISNEYLSIAGDFSGSGKLFVRGIDLPKYLGGQLHLGDTAGTNWLCRVAHPCVASPRPRLARQPWSRRLRRVNRHPNFRKKDA
ncbi:hypothetical protein FRC08_010688 [Ceratobasidium sp. 394]|nr:hypothetical protein FRC08_010688 [Ceratobasidium sp. 394]